MDKRILAMALAVIMVDGFDLQMIGFVAPEIARAWSIDIAAFGPPFAAALIGSIVGALLVGAVTRRIGMRAALVLSLTIFGLGTLLTVGIESIRSLTALRFVVGMGLAAAFPVVLTVICAESPPHLRATFLVAVTCGQPIGSLVGTAICARLMPVFGWKFPFYLGGVVPLILASAILLLPMSKVVMARTNASVAVGRESQGRLVDLFTNELGRRSAVLWSCSFLITFANYIIVNWMPASIRGIGYSLDSTLFAVMLFNIGGIASALVFGRLIDRYGPLKILVLAFSLAGVSMAALDLARSTPAFFFSTMLMTGLFSYGGAIALGSLSVFLYPPPLRVTSNGWMTGIGKLGGAVGPLGAGMALAAGFNVGGLFYFAAAGAFLAVLSLVLLRAALGPQPAPAST